MEGGFPEGQEEEYWSHAADRAMVGFFRLAKLDFILSEA